MTDRVFLRVNDIVLVNTEAVAPTPPPPPPPPPVVTPLVTTNKPLPIGVNYGGDLTGTEGNANEARVYNILAGTVTRWRYSGAGRKQFTSGGLSTNNAPPAVWIWLENARGVYQTAPARILGQNTAPLEPVDVNGDVWFCEQIEADTGTEWNRYAQVNPGSTITPGRGTIGPTVTGR